MTPTTDLKATGVHRTRHSDGEVHPVADPLRPIAGCGICRLDTLRSARTRRERYVGEWIPEPVPERDEWLSGGLGGAALDPADRVSLDESISMAFMVVLESMTPAERVCFILHDVFRYSYAEVAQIVGRTPAACRQLASSGRQRLRHTPVTAATSQVEQQRLIKELKHAWESGDIEVLISLLDPEVTMIADGGGQVSAFLGPIEGHRQVAQHLLEIVSRAPSAAGFVERSVNHRPGLIATHEGTTVTVFAFDLGKGRIKHIWAIRNPDKLGPWA